ncbi:MAG: hypothetical protein MUQ30_04450 [Anaerolineae bacterium]|nr:hypothetical protein [Anaerolineae bacterium]
MRKKSWLNHAVRAGILIVVASLQRVCTQRTLDLFHANEWPGTQESSRISYPIPRRR